MKVLFVSEHCCARVVKEGIALIKAGIDVEFLHQRISNPNFESMLPSISVYKTPTQLAEKIGSMRDIDLIHVHNEPDWMGHICKQFRPDLPVVFDAHDLFSVRVNTMTDDEKASFEVCDAFVYPSQGYYEHCHEWHKDRIKDKPNLVLYSMVNQEFIIRGDTPRIHALAYEGGLRIPETENTIPDEMKYHSYRDFRRIFMKLTAMGIPVMVHMANVDVMDEYVNTGAFIIPPMDYTYLLPRLRWYSWGLAAAPKTSRQWDTAMPHKMFEYMAAGIPIITFNAKEVGDFVTSHGIGVKLDNFQQIPDIFDDWERYRKQVEIVREQFTMENHIDKLIKLYLDIL